MQQTIQYNNYFLQISLCSVRRHPCSSCTWMYLIIPLFWSLFRNFKTIKRFDPVVHEFLESNSLQYFINCIHQMYSTTTVHIYIYSLSIQSEFYHFLFYYYYMFFLFSASFVNFRPKIVSCHFITGRFCWFNLDHPDIQLWNRNWKLYNTRYNPTFTYDENFETIVYWLLICCFVKSG